MSVCKQLPEQVSELDSHTSTSLGSSQVVRVQLRGDRWGQGRGLEMQAGSPWTWGHVSHRELGRFQQVGGTAWAYRGLYPCALLPSRDSCAVPHTEGQRRKYKEEKCKGRKEGCVCVCVCARARACPPAAAWAPQASLCPPLEV